MRTIILEFCLQSFPQRELNPVLFSISPNLAHSAPALAKPKVSKLISLVKYFVLVLICEMQAMLFWQLLWCLDPENQV